MQPKPARRLDPAHHRSRHPDALAEDLSWMFSGPLPAVWDRHQIASAISYAVDDDWLRLLCPGCTRR